MKKVYKVKSDFGPRNSRKAVFLESFRRMAEQMRETRDDFYISGTTESTGPK